MQLLSFNFSYAVVQYNPLTSVIISPSLFPGSLSSLSLLCHLDMDIFSFGSHPMVVRVIPDSAPRLYSYQCSCEHMGFQS